MLARFQQFIACEDGQDLVEYALLAALISISSLAALSTLRFDIIRSFIRILTTLR